MGCWARGEVWIPLRDWYEFVQKYAPSSSDGIYSFGPPAIQDDEMVVPFAMNTEVPPGDEVDPPEWT